MKNDWKPEARIVPVAVIDRADDAEKLAEALIAGGLNQIEVTLRTDAAMESMRRIRKSFPDMAVGAGTILDANVLPELQDMGVAFGISPGLNPSVIERAQAIGFQMVPGVMTPSEVERALGFGLRILKFFPAEAAGGVKMLKALAGPYGPTGVRFIPTGGLSAKNAGEYLALKVTAAIGGSWFVAPELLKEGRFDEIQRLTAEAVALTK